MSSDSRLLSLTILNQVRINKIIKTDSNNTEQEKLNRQKSSELIREVYVNIFRHQIKILAEEPNWWVQQFLDSAEQIYQGLLSEGFSKKEICSSKSLTVPTSSGSNTLTLPEIMKNIENQSMKKNFKIGYGEKLYEFQFQETKPKVIFVGKQEGCNIKLPSSEFISRLALVIYILYDYDLILVVNPGCIHGISVISIESEPMSGKVVHKSKLCDSNTLIFNFTDFVTLKVGGSESVLVLNPLECIVCRDAIREIRLECGHYATCRACSVQLKSCPICRQNITENIDNFQTFLSGKTNC